MKTNPFSPVVRDRCYVVVMAATLFVAGCLPDPAPPPKAAPMPPNSQIAVNPSAETPPGMVREKADVGMGEKGHYGEGVLTTPLDIRWRAEERFILGNIQKAMDLYKAENNRAPKTHQEFMDKIIKANMIKLPELPEGEEYVYDPKSEQLMVQKRAK